ncbi:MAG: hypothetical protein KAR08_04185 [Candidatus Heimdallarchaeota archaeon]|nr:hypothetical protein [Candidatus Heimdallarchaeota archaeon]
MKDKSPTATPSKIKRKGKGLAVFNNGFFRIIREKHFTVDDEGTHTILVDTVNLYYDSEFKFLYPCNGKSLEEIICINKYQRNVDEPCQFVSFGTMRTVDVPIAVLREFVKFRKQHKMPVD